MKKREVDYFKIWIRSSSWGVGGLNKGSDFVGLMETEDGPITREVKETPHWLHGEPILAFQDHSILIAKQGRSSNFKHTPKMGGKYVKRKSILNRGGGLFQVLDEAQIKLIFPNILKDSRQKSGA